MFPGLCTRGRAESSHFLEISAGICGRVWAHSLRGADANLGERLLPVFPLNSVSPRALRGKALRVWRAALCQRQAAACLCVLVSAPHCCSRAHLLPLAGAGSGLEAMHRELSASAAWAVAFPPTLASPDGCLPSLPVKLPVKGLARGLPGLSGGEITGLREVARESRVPSSFAYCIKQLSDSEVEGSTHTQSVPVNSSGGGGEESTLHLQQFQGWIGDHTGGAVLGSQGPSLVREDSRCCGAAETVHHNCGAPGPRDCPATVEASATRSPCSLRLGRSQPRRPSAAKTRK